MTDHKIIVRGRGVLELTVSGYVMSAFRVITVVAYHSTALFFGLFHFPRPLNGGHFMIYSIVNILVFWFVPPLQSL